jgi:hypothetical protein
MRPQRNAGTAVLFFRYIFLEEDVLRCWEAAAKGANVILDVEANAGIYSLTALAIQPDAVRAFEPSSAARNREAKWDRSPVLSRGGGPGTNDGMNLISRDLGDSGTERVQTMCVDQFLQDHSISYIDLMKLAIQAHKYSALEG